MSTESENDELGLSLAMLTLRLWLSIRAIQAGIEKFAGTQSIDSAVAIDGAPNSYGLTESSAEKAYALSNYNGVPAPLQDKFASEPLIPSWGLSLYDTILGPAFIILGLTLLLGLATRISLFVMGLIYTSLTFGLILIKEDSGVAWLGIHIILITVALILAKYNRFAILKKW